MGAAYRCDKCRDQTERCSACRARRAAANALAREQRREAGRCLLCGRKALKGLTRCRHHRDLNRQHSAASHQRARDEAKADA